MPTGDVWRMWVAALLMFTVVMAVFAGLNRCAFGHDRNRPDLDQWYGDLRNPRSNNSAVQRFGCCSKQDCHTTEAEMRGNDWWARLGNIHPPSADWDLQDWVKVPPEAVLLNSTNPTGSAVICHERDMMGGTSRVDPKSRIWCFIPPTES